jgi:hypothetical protein
MVEHKLEPWDDIEQLPGLVQKAWEKVIAAREALNAHMQQKHGGKYLAGCHSCPKLTVSMIEEEMEYHSLNGRLDQMTAPTK